MFIITHAAVGAAIGLGSGNIFAGFFGGWLSHHLLDAIPHFDRGSLYLEKVGPKYLNPLLKISGEKSSSGKLSREEWAIVLSDMAITILALGFLFRLLPLEQFILIFTGVAGAVLPDVLAALFFFCPQQKNIFPTFYRYNRFHHRLHRTVIKKQAWLGILTQILILLTSIIILFQKV